MIDFLDHVSYSNFELFERCPRCWFLKYQLKYEFPSSDALEFGKSVHDAVKKFHLGEEINYSEYSDDEAMQDLIKANVETYHLLYEPEQFDEFEGAPFVEYEFLVDLVHPDTGEVMPVPIKGFIDRVYKNTPHDLKTSSGRYQQTDVDKSHQLHLYAYVYSKITGTTPEQVVYDVLVKNKRPTPQVLYSPKKPNQKLVQKRIDETLRWAFALWNEMQTAEIPDFHGARCWNKRSMI